MLRLTINPQVLAMCEASLKGTTEELAYFAGQLLRSNTEVGLYESTPPAQAGLEVVGPHAATKNGDWGAMVHPHVLAQIVVDLAERLNQPVPDNHYVFIDGDWKPLSFVQPSPRAAPPAPAPVVPPTPPTPPTPDLMAQMASPQVLSTTPLDSLLQEPPKPAAVPAPTPAPSAGESPVTVVGQAQAPGPVSVVGQAQAPAPAAAAAAAFPIGEFGMVQPLLHAVKGSSPFDKDPGGKVPTSPPSRIIRDIVDMAPLFFAYPAAEVVGKSTGSTQRLRAYMAAAALLDQFLSGVPDGNTPVAYLRHQLAHLRYNASMTPAGPTMKAHEDYLMTPETGEK